MPEGPPAKVCDWPEEPPGSGRWGCGQPVWFHPTGRVQADGRPVLAVVNADGADHHGDCTAWRAREERLRVERASARAAAAADRPTLF